MGREVLRGGGTTPDGKEQIAEDEELYVSKEDITSMIVVQIDDSIKRRGFIPKRRKEEKHNQLKICVDNKIKIYQGPVANMSQLSGFTPTAKWKVLEPQEEVVEEPVNEFDFRAPTIEEHEDPTTPNHNFNETFDLPMFKGRSYEGGVHLKG